METIEKSTPSSDRRSSYRLPLTPGAAAIDVPGSSRVPLVDLSADGGRLALEGRAPLPESRIRGTLHLEGRGSVGLELELVRRESGAGAAPAVGAQFVGLSPRASRELSGFVIDGVTRQQRRLTRLAAAPSPQLRVRRPGQIHDLLRLHGLGRAQVMSVYEADDPLPPRLRMSAIEAAGHLAVTSEGESQLEAGRTYSFLLPAAGAALLFEATVQQRQNGSATLSFPSEVRQGGFRDWLRVPTWNGDGVSVSFSSRRAPGRRTTRWSRDVSRSGLSFPFFSGEDWLVPGDRLTAVEIELEGGTVRAEAVVRTIAPRGADGGVSCGIELTEFAGVGDRERWGRFVFGRAWPRTFDRHPELARLAWGVLDTSEYLRLWTPPEERDRLERQFLFTWDSPALVPGHLIVLREESRTVGTFATSQVYPSTWLLHSLGVDRDERRKRRYFLEAARELYVAMLSLLKGANGARHFVLFVQKDKRWTDLLYGGFVEALPHGAPSVYDEYSLYKCRPRAVEATGGAPPAGWRVERAEGDGLRAVARHLDDILTPLEREAYAYDEENIDLRGFAGRSPALFRREVFVARDARGDRATLVAECGNDGVNVFGLLNSCRIHALAPFADEAEEKAVCAALLAAASGFYRDNGVEEYIVFATTGAMVAATADAGGQLVSTGVRWLASCELLPAWINYVDEVLQVRTLDARGEA